MKFKKLNMHIENNCLEKLCVYCLLDCKKHSKSINTYTLIEQIGVYKNNINYNN